MDKTDAQYDPIKEEALDWLLRVTEAPHDRSLRTALAAWRAESDVHDKAFRSVARMWRISGNLPRDYCDAGAPPQSDKGLSAQDYGNSAFPRRMASRHQRKKPRSGWSGRRIAAGLLAAGIAACLILAFAPALHVQLYADYATRIGEIRTVSLVDGSALHLDADSAVAVDRDGSERAVTLLSGQAYFDVARSSGRPFTVSADGLVVTVRGTGFTVSSGRDAISVSVAEGLVEVAPSVTNRHSVFLRAGDRLTLSRATGAISMAKVLPRDVAAWRTGQLVVNGLPLREVAEHIGRYYHGVILIPDDNLATRRITGVFNLDDPVGAVRAAAQTQSAHVTTLTPYLLLIGPR